MGGLPSLRNTALDNFVKLNPSQRKAAAIAKKAIKKPCKDYKTLPKTVPEIMALLTDLKAKGLIIFGKQNIRSHLQKQIDSSSNDLHLIFGTWHKSPGQYAYLNELLYGKQEEQLTGITHIVTELFGQGSVDEKKAEEFALKYKEKCDEKCKTEAEPYIHGDLQYFIDLYQRYNSQGALRVLSLYGETYFKKEYPFETFQNTLNTITLNRANNNKYTILASDISNKTERALKEKYGEEFIMYELREYLASSHALQAQDPSKKDVLFYIWGADHIDKYALPKFIPTSDTALSIGLSGGSKQNSKSLLEEAIRQLGWGDKEFLVVFNEKGQIPYQEFDLLIHLPFTDSTSPSLDQDANPYNIYTRPSICPPSQK